MECDRQSSLSARTPFAERNTVSTGRNAMRRQPFVALWGICRPLTNHFVSCHRTNQLRPGCGGVLRHATIPIWVRQYLLDSIGDRDRGLLGHADCREAFAHSTCKRRVIGTNDRGPYRQGLVDRHGETFWKLVPARHESQVGSSQRLNNFAMRNKAHEIDDIRNARLTSDHSERLEIAPANERACADRPRRRNSASA